MWWPLTGQHLPHLLGAWECCRQLLGASLRPVLPSISSPFHHSWGWTKGKASWDWALGRRGKTCPRAELQEGRVSSEQHQLQGWGQRITGEVAAAIPVILTVQIQSPSIATGKAEHSFWKSSVAVCAGATSPSQQSQVPARHPVCQHSAVLRLLPNKALIGFISHWGKIQQKNRSRCF